MGIDWENILGDKVDLGDAYDSMVFGTSLNNDNSESERPYSLRLLIWMNGWSRLRGENIRKELIIKTVTKILLLSLLS